MAFPTIQDQNTLEAQRFANALYNIQLGSDTLDQVIQEGNQLASMRAAFDRYYQFTFEDNEASTADAADTLAANFGIVEGNNGLTAADVLLAETYFYDTLNAATFATRGATTQDIIHLFSGLDEAGIPGSIESIYGTTAAEWNAEIAIALDYDGVNDVAPGTVDPINAIFLTAFQDILAGTSGDDLFLADVVQEGGPQRRAQVRAPARDPLRADGRSDAG